MKKAKMTKAGAEKLAAPNLAGKTIEYDGVTKPRGDDSVIYANEMYYKGKCIGINLSFTGDEPGLVALDE